MQAQEFFREAWEGPWSDQVLQILRGQELAIAAARATAFSVSQFYKPRKYLFLSHADDFSGQAWYFPKETLQILAVATGIFILPLSRCGISLHSPRASLNQCLLPTDSKIPLSTNQLIPKNPVLRNLAEHLTATTQLSKYWQKESFNRNVSSQVNHLLKM